MPRKYRRAFPTVQAFMDETGTNSQELARRVGISPQHMSNILRKSRRASLGVALKLSQITNVPIETIAEWPPKYEEAVR